MDKMTKAFLQTLEPGKSYSYAEIMDRIGAFIQGWKAAEQSTQPTAHVAGVSGKRREWSPEQRAKYQRTIACKNGKRKK